MFLLADPRSHSGHTDLGQGQSAEHRKPRSHQIERRKRDFPDRMLIDSFVTVLSNFDHNIEQDYRTTTHRNCHDCLPV